jgi:hypothetical protein
VFAVFLCLVFDEDVDWDCCCFVPRIGKCLVLAGRKPGGLNTAGFSVVNFGVNNLTATSRTDLANKYKHVNFFLFFSFQAKAGNSHYFFFFILCNGR